MPTKHPRHAITETPAVRTALDAVRTETGVGRPNLAELVILGAEVKVQRVRAERASADGALEALAQMILTAAVPVDPDAADDVRRHGWSRPV